MDKSKFLAKVIGVYLTIVSISMLLTMEAFVNHLMELINNPTLMFVTGFFTLILGILMVANHNLWQWNWRVIVTILAWLTLIKGLMLILYPEFMGQFSLMFLDNINTAYISAGIDLVLGLILCYFGFRRLQ